MATVKIEEVDLISEQSELTDYEQDPNLDENYLFEAPLVGCPMCAYASDNQTILQAHIEEHLQQDEEFDCPMCSQKFKNAALLEFHFNEQHADLPKSEQVQNTNGIDDPCPVCQKSDFVNRPARTYHIEQHFIEASQLAGNLGAESKWPAEPLPSTSRGASLSTNRGANNTIDPTLTCPVCFISEFNDPEGLRAHVENHFNDNTLMVNKRKKSFEEDQVEDVPDKKGKKGTNRSRANGLIRQTESTLMKAAQRGHISPVEYHEQIMMMKQFETKGVDNSLSVTEDVIPHLVRHCNSTPCVERVWFCNPSMDHFASGVGDFGWACGYRNLQMMLSSLLRHRAYVERLKIALPDIVPNSADEPFPMPSITRLQRAIEEAWGVGFDPAGCGQLGGELLGTKKWIGPTEIASFLGFCRIRYRLVDFREPSSEDGKHPVLFNWVLNYFKRPSDLKPPIFLQHDGHSRTIVGIEEQKLEKTRLLVVDPSHKTGEMELMKRDLKQTQVPVLKKIRILQSTLKAKQYQMVCVDDGFVDNQQEYEAGKLLASVAPDY